MSLSMTTAICARMSPILPNDALLVQYNSNANEISGYVLAVMSHQMTSVSVTSFSETVVARGQFLSFFVMSNPVKGHHSRQVF